MTMNPGNQSLSHLVIYRYKRVMRRERPCGSLSVHEEGLGSAVHHVLLYLGDVVRDVVDHVHVEVVGVGLEHLGKRREYKIDI